MSAFLFVVDPDPVRRATYLERARASLAPPFPGLRRGEFTRGDSALLWAQPEHAPPPHEDERGVALLLGEALSELDGAPQTPSAVLAAWTETSAPSAEAFDGYHAALVLDAAGTLRLGGDRLGLFPLYVWEAGDVFLAAASPEPIRYHTAFTERLDLVGLAGILLTNGLVGGRTLWEGVRRIDAGRMIVRPRGGPSRAVGHHALPFSRQHFARSQDELVAMTHAVVRDAMQRHAGPTGRGLALQLSGGLDSRLLAAYLRVREPRPVAATFGRAHDLDVRYARKTVAVLGFDHHEFDDNEEEFGDLARLTARWEHLAGGFSLPNKWSSARRLASLPTRVVSGLAFDAVVGPYGWVDTRRQDVSPCDQVIQSLSTWGLAPARARRLFRDPAGEEAVEEVLATLRRAYEVLPSDDPYHRAHALYLLHRQRYHVGAVAWSVAFTRTPVLPVLDRRLLTFFLGLSEASIMDRRIERALLRRQGPDLVRIPLAANARDAWSPEPGIRERLVRRVRALRHARRRWLGRHGEPRRFVRLADLNGPGWRRIRVAAEAGREAWHEVFRPDALRALVPPPEVAADGGRDAAAGAPARNILGLFLWGRERTLPYQ